ncbi:MAG: 3'(2'),5'-bisphosphate nucleotidase CysQ [Alistipes sp.]|nr:3'(2'),5'-bisphosphate nucleotidase CysQ [Alistipes sp.]
MKHSESSVTQYQHTSNDIEQDTREYLLEQQLNAAVRAGAAIMKIYKNSDDYDISLKSDSTPITIADRMAHITIKEALGQTRIPILSEEGREMLYEERRNWELFWLVDPLDGTVEFIKGNNEFTVNIALMRNNICISAVVYVPFHHKMYIAERGYGSWVMYDVAPEDNANYTYEQIHANIQQLPLEAATHSNYRVAVSRSHQTSETHEHIGLLRRAHPDLEIVEQGSSYKFCLLAEGTVDYYIRTTTTSEWDTAAGELILAESGGTTSSYPAGTPLLYNKETLDNPWFVAKRVD